MEGSGKISGYFTELKACSLCPRNCLVDRTAGKKGICGESAVLRIARAALHMWEEPCISGRSGSGAVFFSGCPLHCIFCQNREIACGGVGQEVTTRRLAEIFMELMEQGANNINLVTADHYLPAVAEALTQAKKHGLTIPVVYNTSSYISVEALKRLEGLVDVYLPDFKYITPEFAQACAAAKDYPEAAKAAIAEMVRQTGVPVFYERTDGKTITAAQYNEREARDGEEILIKKGTIVRHLILPGHITESKRVLSYLTDTYGDQIYISIMNQYTPVNRQEKMPELNRKVTRREYEKVLEFAFDKGIENGFLQEGDTAAESFIPSFDGSGVMQKGDRSWNRQ